ncbi:MAG: hypothetical protein ACYDGY_06510 [Acidimicrobiales bacterium]
MVARTYSLKRSITAMRRGWVWRVGILLVAVAAGVGLSLGTGGSVSGTTSGSNTPGPRQLVNSIALSPNTPASGQVAWLCEEARTQVESHIATGFMSYMNRLCSKEGATALNQSLHSSMPLGALICQYAEHQVAVKAATKTDQMTANQCIHSPPQPTGIFPDRAAPPRGFDIAVTDSWVGYVNGHYTSVLAGAEEVTGANGTSSTTQIGKVMVIGGPNEGMAATTTSADGALRITSAHDGVLSMVAEDGARYRFDIQSDGLTKVDP